MYKRVFVAIALILASAAFAQAAEDIYIAQSTAGSDTGADCANAHNVAWFNTATNWAIGTAKISAGDTVHLCGTISTQMTARGSGTSGSPITILFEPNAKISLATCDINNGCLSVSTRSYIVVDGGSNGIIENTASGTNLANRVASRGIMALSCSNCEFRNLVIQNLYIHTSASDTAIDQTQNNAIYFSGSNILIHDNILHDMGWALMFGYGNGDNNIQIYNNDIYNIDHGVIIGGWATTVPASNIKIYNNHIHDYANWDTTSNAYHHDGIHAYATPPAKATDVWIYNNLFDGAVGQSITAHIFMEGGSGTPWTDSAGYSKIFNNVFSSDGPINNGLAGVFAGSVSIYNNAFIGATVNAGACLMVNTNGIASISNNVMSGCNALIYVASTASLPSPGSLDYNAYANCATSFNCFWVGTVDTANFALYQSQTGYDAHSVANITSSQGLDATGHPQTGSLVINAGTNLASLGIAALNSDKSGAPRPSSGAWEVGAYEFTSGGADTTPPVISGGIPSGILASGTTQTTLQVTTNEAATCKYSASAGVAYASMPGTFTTTGGTTHSKLLTGLADGASYNYYVRCIDASGNVDTSDYAITFSIAQITNDTTSPTVSITSPAGGTQSGTITITATASDNVAVAGVQFKVDGNNIGAEDTSSPYSVSLDTTTLTNANHVLTAVARDTSSLTTTSADVTISVNNTVLPSSLSFEAESGTITAPFAITSTYVSQATQTTLAASGRASYIFNITTAGNYFVKTTINAPVDASNSLFINIDSEPTDPTMVWDIPITIGFQERNASWRGAGTFDNNEFVPKVFSLTTGQHTLIIRGREADVQIDSIRVESYGSTTSSTTSPTVTTTDGSSGGGGGGTGPSSATQSVPRTYNFIKIIPGETAIFRDFNSEIGINQIEITVNNDAEDVKINIVKYGIKPEEVSVEKSGEVYQYLQINTTNLENKINKTTVQFRVEKSWVSDNSLNKEEVSVYKFNETAEAWNELQKKSSSEDSQHYYYDIEMDSFSYFVISGKTSASEEGTGFAERLAKWFSTLGEGKSMTWLLISTALVIVIVLIIIILVLRLMRRRTALQMGQR